MTSTSEKTGFGVMAGCLESSKKGLERMMRKSNESLDHQQSLGKSI